MISDSLIAILFIAIPSTLIAAIIMIITKDRVYALRSIALYLLVSATVLLANDDNVRVSVAMTLGGAIILLSSLLFKLKLRTLNLGILVLSFLIPVALLVVYALYPISENIDFSISYEYEGCSFSSRQYYPGCNLILDVKPEIKGILPLNLKYEISLCEKSGTRKYYSYYDGFRDAYIFNIYSKQDYDYLNNNIFILCIDTQQNSNCRGCLYEKELIFK